MRIYMDIKIKDEYDIYMKTKDYNRWNQILIVDFELRDYILLNENKWI